MTAASANKVTVPGDNRLDELKLGNKTPFWHKIPIIKELRVAVGWQKGMLITGLVLTAFFLLVAIFAPLIAPYSYAQLKGADGVSFPAQAAPSSEHIWGTTAGGYDVFSRVVWGARTAVIAIVVAVLLSIFAGVLLGLVSGYFGGWLDNVMMRVVEVINGIPYMIVVILLMMVLDPGMGAIIVAYSLVGWTGMARLVRGQIVALKEQEFVIAAQAMGAKPSRIIAKHLLPNLLSVVIVNVTLAIPSVIFSEAFLSFIGLGVPIPMSSWGTLANDAIIVFRSYPMQLFLPSLCICLTMLGFNLLGDGLRDALDPRLKK